MRRTKKNNSNNMKILEENVIKMSSQISELINQNKFLSEKLNEKLNTIEVVDNEIEVVDNEIEKVYECEEVLFSDGPMGRIYYSDVGIEPPKQDYYFNNDQYNNPNQIERVDYNVAKTLNTVKNTYDKKVKKRKIFFYFIFTAIFIFINLYYISCYY